MKRIFQYFRNSSIRSRLILAFIFLISVPMCVIGIRYYTSTRDMIFDIAQKNVYEIVKKNNEVIDSKLKKIKDDCWDLMSDNEFIEKSSSMELDNNYKMVSMDIELTKILNKYFQFSQDISSAQLMTSFYEFGYSSTSGYDRNYLPIDAFKNSELYASAVKAKGKLEWFPTYDFSHVFRQLDSNNNGDHKYMFSALQHMKTANLKVRNINGSAEVNENPILIVNFDEKLYHDIFKSSITMKDSYFFVITKDGQYVSHQDKNKIGTKVSFPWLESVSEKGSGREVVKIDGKRTLICYDTSNETGWISVIAIDYNSLLGSIFSSLKINSIYLVIVLTIIPILISYFVSDTITKPITKLSKAIKQTGDGDFSNKIPEERSMEFNNLINRFNSMNEKIQRLIQENYEIKIREKEAEINALNLQLNPHFMYNTLNIVNLKLIQNGQDEVSEMVMSLSTMLKFSAKNKNSLVLFEQELDYIKGYIYIMSKRFEGKFSVIYDIDEELFEYSVPKFLLQPFVENSLIHGFEPIKEGGTLKILCHIEGNRRIFVIEDNGKGMDEEKVAEIMNGNPDSAGIGINNVRRRIQIIYGNEYDIDIESKLNNGTRITICLPLTS